MDQPKNQFITDDDIYHDLMAFKVKEILLITTRYDAFALQQESQLPEQLFGEYFQLNLSNAPRITSVTNGADGLEALRRLPIDLVILMMRIEGASPFELARKIRQIDDSVPILLLLKDNTEIRLLGSNAEKSSGIDNCFVWNGESKIFIAMIKYVEDKINVVNDTKIGLVRVVLLVEDSVRYYSRYLPQLYSEIIKQTQRLIAEEHLVQLKKLLRMRARPKVLMAKSYEDAVEIISRYGEFLLCVISDVKFMRNGILDDKAGIDLIKLVKHQTPDLPVLLQSSEQLNSRIADDLRATFINKNSNSLTEELTRFIQKYLGFGDFIFRTPDAGEIAKAKNFKEILQLINIIPIESLVHHGNQNHFSAWLMARGEIHAAQKIQPIKVSDFLSLGDLRNYLIEKFTEISEEKTRGKLIAFDETAIGSNSQIVRLGSGSLGGKGRGLAFMNQLLQRDGLNSLDASINIAIPATAIIGADEYDFFIERNLLSQFRHANISHSELQQKFLAGELSAELDAKLRKLLTLIRKPLAVRSSSLFEDSMSHPFSGVYPTFIIPNNHPSSEERLRQLRDAIRLIYAAVYSVSARSYFHAINHSIEEEKMAVLIQEAVGHAYEKRFYPHISGIAQSYNYYPFSYIKPEDGFAIIAAGFGKYIEDAKTAWRFCPKHPKLDIYSTEDQLKYSQNHIYALDMTISKRDLIAGEDSLFISAPLHEIEKDGTLEYMASVWNPDNDRFEPGIHSPGRRILDFACILKYDVFPLAPVLNELLSIFKKALGTPVEIEFGVDLNRGANDKPTFYIYQAKHFMGALSNYSIDPSAIVQSDLVLMTRKGMGNGRIDGIQYIILVDPDKFDPLETHQIAEELERLNTQMESMDLYYILIGPGRWGTRDPFLGIPVAWTQISQACAIVEAGLKDYRVEASLGSHFFHNLTSMNIGYFSAPFEDSGAFIDWSWLKDQPVSQSTQHCSLIELDNPVTILMDGRQGLSVIYKRPLDSSNS
jgi:CheY-like chemotaxis protein